MVVLKSEIEDMVNEELRAHEDFLKKCFNNNRPFDYLKHVAKHHGFNEQYVFDDALDRFSYYSSMGASSYRAFYLSVCRTHELIVRDCLKKKD